MIEKDARSHKKKGAIASEAARKILARPTNEIKNKQVREQVHAKQQSLKGKLKRERREVRKRNVASGVAVEPLQTPRTVENSCSYDQPIVAQLLAKDDGTEQLAALQQDEFAEFFQRPAEYVPKVLITTSQKCTRETRAFVDALVDVIPHSTYITRKRTHLMREIISGAVERKYTCIVVVREGRKTPRFLTLINLPDGPTATFKISSIKHGKALVHHGRSSDHFPELILNNFSTTLGFTVGRFFASLFPKGPDFEGRQVVTFHNQRDFIFVRRHRYQISAKSAAVDEASENATANAAEPRVNLQEIGPRFCLKLLSLQKGTCEGVQAAPDAEFKHDFSKPRNLFSL